MERNVSQNGLVNWIALLVAGAVMAFGASYARSAAAEVAIAWAIVGLLVALVSWFQMRLEAREDAERLEFDELAKAKASSALFQADAGTFPARRAREQFEKWFVPGFTILLFLVEGGAVWWFWQKLRDSTLPSPLVDASRISMGVFAVVAVFLVLLGLYAAKLARYGGHRLLRPGASAMLLLALLAGACAIVEVATFSGQLLVDRYAAWVFVGLLVVVATETLLTLVFEVFRPRVRGEQARLVYESRLIGLLGQPGGLFKTAAHALDYQFGFKVSDTWFYKFLEQALARLVLLWLAILWLSSAFVFIEPGEQGLLERFGQPVASRAVLEPGLSFKLPWPIDAVHRYTTREVQTFNVGFTPDPEKEKDRTLLWTRPHYKEEFHMLVASRDSAANLPQGDEAQRVPVNLLIASIPVQYVVSDVKAWAYNHADGAQLLERLGNREVVRYLASVDMDEIMSRGRLKAATDLEQRIQAKADEHRLGVKITFVGLQDIHPPMGSREEAVAAAYEKVIGAIAEKEARIHQAEGFYAETLPKAAAEAAKKVDDAKADAARKIEVARGQADQFQNQLIAFKAAPNVFRERTKNEALSRAIAPTRKYVVLSTNAHDVITLNLEQKIRDDLEGLVIEPVKKDTK